MVYLITCAFTLFCPAHTDCSEYQKEVPSVIKIRTQDDVMLADFWTPGSPASMPWPAIVSRSSFGPESWTFFTSGDVHGSWMLSVTLPSQAMKGPFETEGLLSVHITSFMTDVRIMAARDVCKIEKEGV